MLSHDSRPRGIDKPSISTRQIQRMLQCSMKTAWHLTHRIRLAMADGDEAGPLGAIGKHVEADETYYGNKPGRDIRRGTGHKRVVVSLVERGGDVRVRCTAYTNTLEGCFSLFKRSMVGVYQQCDERHLHRYLAEFYFRYNARQSLGVNDQ